MQKLATGMQNKKRLQQGFTLLEILIVVVIVSITLGFALLAFGDFGAKRRVLVAAEQFINHVKLTQQQAILESGTLGIQVSSQGYKMLRFNSQGYWQSFPEKGIYKFQPFPRQCTVKWQTTIKANNEPEIIIHSSGDMTPFILYFNSEQNSQIAVVKATHDGHIYMESTSGNEPK